MTLQKLKPSELAALRNFSFDCTASSAIRLSFVKRVHIYHVLAPQDAVDWAKVSKEQTSHESNDSPSIPAQDSATSLPLHDEISYRLP